MIIKAPVYKDHNTTLYYCPACKGILGTLIPCNHFVSTDSNSTVVLLNIPPDICRKFDIRENYNVNLIAVSDSQDYHRTKITEFFTKNHDFKEVSFKNIILNILLKEKIILKDEIETELAKWFIHKTYDIITKHVDQSFIINSMHNTIQDTYENGHKNIIISDIDILPGCEQIRFVKTYNGTILSINKGTPIDSIYVIEISPNSLNLFLKEIVLRFAQPYPGRTHKEALIKGD